ncbi:MAG: 16S rRNA (cytosine(1402)-N(4))-methyltransferase RsmH [Pseudomonadota bacterium]
MSPAASSPAGSHIPVLLSPLLDAVAPVQGHWLDGTFGAGGYSRGLLEAGAAHVTAIDRDPDVFAMAADWAGPLADRLTLIEGTFGQLDTYADDLDGVVLDLGVSSMQLDQAERGFSFLRDGPLDMRMAQDGQSAADLCNSADETVLADILYIFGEERAARRIARGIVRARGEAPITTTRALAQIVEAHLPRAKPGQAHPATRTFQALRIAVNDEFGELADALAAAERALKPGGLLAIVTFHSLEDRMVKRFFQDRSGGAGQGSRHAPPSEILPATFNALTRKPIAASDAEIAANPRARSAKLRVGRRTEAAARPLDQAAIGMPALPGRQQR